MIPLDQFKHEITAMIERVKATPRQPGVAEIRIASQRAFHERRRALREGIEMDEAIHQALLALAG